jgi:putrescine aminotransferase
MIMAPPLICTKGEIDDLVEMLTVALDKTADHYGVS